MERCRRKCGRKVSREKNLISVRDVFENASALRLTVYDSSSYVHRESYFSHAFAARHRVPCYEQLALISQQMHGKSKNGKKVKAVRRKPRALRISN